MLAETKQVNAETKNFKSAIENNVTKITDSESARITAENGRVNAEETRKQAESGRVDAEKHRTQSEESRTQAEKDRIAKETDRLHAESIRVNAEKIRNEAEEKRNSFLKKSETLFSESTTLKGTLSSLEIAVKQAEEIRINAENARINAQATNHQIATEDHAKITSVLDVIKRLETGEIVAKVAELENKGATKEYVRAQISALIDGAPQDLDTLKELADALKARGGTEEILAKLGSKIDRTQLDEELKQLDSKLTNLIGSKAAQSDLESGLAGKVKTADFDTYKSEATKAIADKVSASNFNAYKDEVAKAMTGKVPTTDFDTYKEEASKLIASKAGAAELENLKSQVGDDLQAKLEDKVDKSKVYTGDYSGAKLAEFKPGASAAPISVASTEKLAAKIIDSLPRPCLTGEDTLKYSEANGTLLYSETPDGCIFPNGKIVSANDMLSTFCTLWGVTASLLQGCEYRADDINALMDALTCPDFNGLALDQNHAIFLGRFGEILVCVIDALIRSGAFASRLGVLDDIRQIRKLKEDLEIATADSAYLLAAHRMQKLTSGPSLTLAQWGKFIDKKAGVSRYEVLAVDEFFAQTYARFPAMMFDVPYSPERKKEQIFDAWRELNGQADKAFNANICTFPRLVFLSVFSSFEATKPYNEGNLLTTLADAGFYFLLEAIAVSRANMSGQNFGRPSEWLVGLLGGILAAMVRYVLTCNLSEESIYYFNDVMKDLAANEATKLILPILRKASSSDGKAKKFTEKVERAIIALARAELETEAATKRDPHVNDVLLEFDDHMPMIKKYAHALASGNCLSKDRGTEYEPEKEDDGND